jgi:hypothetical protein
MRGSNRIMFECFWPSTLATYILSMALCGILQGVFKRQIVHDRLRICFAVNDLGTYYNFNYKISVSFLTPWQKNLQYNI